MAVAYKLVVAYRLLNKDETRTKATEKELNKLAAQGWRVILCVATEDRFCWTLERESVAILAAQKDELDKLCDGTK